MRSTRVLSKVDGLCVFYCSHIKIYRPRSSPIVSETEGRVLGHDLVALKRNEYLHIFFNVGIKCLSKEIVLRFHHAIYST